jgi:hypothetical protein
MKAAGKLRVLVASGERSPKTYKTDSTFLQANIFITKK